MTKLVVTESPEAFPEAAATLIPSHKQVVFQDSTVDAQGVAEALVEMNARRTPATSVVFDHVLSANPVDEEVQEFVGAAAIMAGQVEILETVREGRVADLVRASAEIFQIETKTVSSGGDEVVFIVSGRVLDDEAAQLQRAQARHPAIVDAATLVRAVDQALDQHRPFSMVRLGHCEARFMGFETVFTQQAVSLSTRMQWGQKNVALSHLQRMSEQIRESARWGDFIGVPKPNKTVIDRFTLLNNAVFTLGQKFELFSGRVQFVSANVHWDLGRSPAFFEMLAAQREIVLITCRNVEDRLTYRLQRYSDDTPRLIRIDLPGEFRRLGDAKLEEKHFPDAFVRILHELRSVAQPGTLVLVGAGLMGKVFCTEVKRLGGVALDIGSLFDVWAGFVTRGSGFPEELLLEKPPGLSAEGVFTP